MVSTLATIYKKLKLETNENLGWGKIRLPELELHTTACWWRSMRALRGLRRGGGTSSTWHWSEPVGRSRRWGA